MPSFTGVCDSLRLCMLRNEPLHSFLQDGCFHPARSTLASHSEFQSQTKAERQPHTLPLWQPHIAAVSCWVSTREREQSGRSAHSIPNCFFTASPGFLPLAFSWAVFDQPLTPPSLCSASDHRSLVGKWRPANGHEHRVRQLHRQVMFDSSELSPLTHTMALCVEEPV